jgi:hypothetical protein
MQNVNNGMEIHEQLKLDRNQLATLGAYLIQLEFDEYKKLIAKKKFKFDTIDLGKGKLF